MEDRIRLIREAEQLSEECIEEVLDYINAALYIIHAHIVTEEEIDNPHVEAHAMEPTSALHGLPVNDIEDELRGADIYLKRYADTLDADYLQMTFDETTHALKFMRALPENDMKREYMVRHDQIVERIKAHGMTA